MIIHKFDMHLKFRSYITHLRLLTAKFSTTKKPYGEKSVLGKVLRQKLPTTKCAYDQMSSQQNNP